MENTPHYDITSLDQLREEFGKIVARADFNAMGQVKPHMDKTDPAKPVETGDYFLSVSTKLPQGTAVVIDGEKWYPNTLQLRVDAFKLRETPGKDEPATAKAATANANILRSRLKGAGAVVAVAPVKKDTPVS